MAKRKRYGTGFGTTSTPGDVLRRKNRRYNKHRNPRAALQRLMRDVFGVDVNDMTMDVGGDMDIEEILAEIIPPDNERRANANRQARLAKVAQALAPSPERVPPKKGVSLPRVSRDERAASIAAERFDPRTEALRRLEERGGLSSSQRIPGEPSVVAEAQVTEEDDNSGYFISDGSWTDSIQEVIEQIKSQIGKYPPESEKRIADAKKAHDAQTKRMIELAGTRDSVMDEPVRGYYVDSQMDEPVMDDSVSVESFMDEPIDAYDPNTVMQPEDLKVDYGFDIRATEPGMSRGTEQAEQMIKVMNIDETTDETMERLPGLHRSHQHADSGSRVSVDPVKKMEESWYDAEGNKTNRLGATIDNFFRGIFGGAEPGGETSPWGILAKQDLTKFKDESWLAEGGMVRKKYRKGGKVKFNSGGTVGWGKAIKGHNTNRDICKKCPI